MGASAVKLLIYYHPDASNVADQECLVADVAAACREHDLPLVLEPLGVRTSTTLTRRSSKRVGYDCVRRAPGPRAPFVLDIENA